MAICDLKRDNVYALAAVLLLVVAVSVFASVISNSLQPEKEDASKKPFYLGVTYCGSSVNEACQLVDKVKNYTNLFIVQSYYLQTHIDELIQVCDYAVNEGLDLIVYFGAYHAQENTVTSFLCTAESRWGSHFLGLYYNDEPGGKMLDLRLELGNITKYEDGGIKQIDKSIDTSISASDNSASQYKETYFQKTGVISTETTESLHQNNTSKYFDTKTTYQLNGTIQYSIENRTFNSAAAAVYSTALLFYHPDGSVQDENGIYVTDQGDITQFTPYQQLWDSRPIQTYSDASKVYTDGMQKWVDFVKNQSTCKVFTSDYALYWFDYEAGYDTVLAQLGPNENPKQEIALVRGAASMHDKPWGTILTWKNGTDPSSLMSGDEMFENLRLSYQSGAEYAAVFNYSPDNGAGLLQDEHYLAIERFWKEIIRNPDITNNIKMQTALVLPADYGWGMRSVNDTIWGLWQPDDKAAQIWNAIQNHLDSKDGKLDIIYEDSAAQANSRYSNVYYWNNTT